MTPVERQLAPPGGWRVSENPTITPLRRSQLRWPLRAVLWASGKLAEKRTGSAQVPDVFLLLLRHPRLFWPWLRFASRLMPYGSLDRRDAELLILRVGWNCRCRYEWGQHVPIALRAGLPAADIARIALGIGHPGWAPRQAALMQAADELHADHRISDQTWSALSAHYRASQLIEIGMLIGHYEMLAGVLNSVGISLEAGTEALLAEAPIHQ